MADLASLSLPCLASQGITHQSRRPLVLRRVTDDASIAIPFQRINSVKSVPGANAFLDLGKRRCGGYLHQLARAATHIGGLRSLCGGHLEPTHAGSAFLCSAGHCNLQRPSRPFLLNSSRRGGKRFATKNGNGASSSGGNQPGDETWAREEARWQREEERWLREELRWERERQRWAQEKSQLEGHVALLQSALEKALGLLRGADVANGPVPLSNEDGVYDVDVRLQALGLLSLNGTLSSPTTPSKQSTAPYGSEVVGSRANSLWESSTNVPSKQSTVPPKTSAIPASSITVPSSTAAPTGASTAPLARRTLRKGLEGDDVREMQTALVLQGFYFEEEDLENAYFSESTESAVKSWQASVRVREDGLMTPELLLLLFGGDEGSDSSSDATGAVQNSSSSAGVEAKPAVSSPSPSARADDAFRVQGSAMSKGPEPTRDRPEIERYARSHIEAGEHRVYLLGENRWEDPSRLHSSPPGQTRSTSGKPVAAGVSTAPRTVNRGPIVVDSKQRDGTVPKAGLRSVTLCFQCRGEGRMTCLECEGTGDLNVEEQFADWVVGDAKCLYCEGIGAQACDACQGSGHAESD